MRISDWSSDVCSSDLLLDLTTSDRISGVVMGSAPAASAQARSPPSCLVPRLPARLEHVQHPLGHHVTAGGVARAQQHRGESDHLLQRRVGVAEHAHRAAHHTDTEEVAARTHGSGQEPPPPTAAPKPITFSSVVSAWPSTTIAPISTMPWMKLLPDISGVCRITGTREMITLPAIAASMKMYSATKPSPIAALPIQVPAS